MIQNYTREGLSELLRRARETCAGPLNRPYHLVRVMIFGRLAGVVEILSGDYVFFPLPGAVRREDMPSELLDMEGIQADTELLNSCYWIREELAREAEEAKA